MKLIQKNDNTYCHLQEFVKEHFETMHHGPKNMNDIQ